jgi:hypothetical protein
MWPLCAWLAVLAACSAATTAGGTATVPATVSSVPGTAPSTTPTAADPWAVPATITPGYLDRVLAELDHIDGDAFRDARAHNAVTPRFVELEQAIRAGPHDVRVNENLVTNQVKAGWPNIRLVPSDRRTTVETLLTAPAPCIFASVSVDFSGFTVGPPTQYPQWYVALVPSPVSTLNPTHWVLADDGFEPGGGPPTAVQACSAN